MDRVTAVVATYDGHKHFVGETLDSLKDNGIGYEVINNGWKAGVNWNNAISSCKTEYLVLPHSDDVYLPNYVSEMAAYMDANPEVPLAFCMDIFIDAKGNRIAGGTILPISEQRTYDFKTILNAVIRHGNFLRCETIILRPRLLDGLRFKEHCGTANDTAFWFDILNRHNIGIVNKPLVRYRVHEGQDTASQRGGNQPLDHWDAIRYAVSLRPDALEWDTRISVNKVIEQNDAMREGKRLEEKIRNAKQFEFYVCHEPPDNAGTGVLAAHRCRERNKSDEEQITIYVYPHQGSKENFIERGVPVLRFTPGLFDSVIKEYNPVRIEYHHTLRWPKEILDIKGTRKYLYFHDFFILGCEMYHLYNREGKVCEEITPEQCERICGIPKTQVRQRQDHLRKAAEGMDGIYANSDYTAGIAEKILGKRPEVVTFDPPPLGTPFVGKKVGYFGNWYPVKGCDILLEVAHLMPEVQFVLFSDVPPDILKGRSVYGYPNTIVMGRYLRPDLSLLVNLVDVVVCPSRNESYGLVRRECERLGKKVVATDVGGLCGTVKPEAGEIAKAIKEVINGQS